ncbi:DUF4429 domain-containing protein [Streptomyces sp. Tu102]|uniref:DUF4429 domain-containing protein n=1 Tax=Streptomyces TaxID=1883 RepID=UPI001BDBE883|nr:DUF4429 domain-containing protein [Streptomyces sp. Tu102]MBT1094104.1 DUF4429 domain-containing protein [Streptomyces sp. Tu102]
MEIKCVMALVRFENGWITISKNPKTPQEATVRFRAADVTASRYRSGTRLRNGYLQFKVPKDLVTQGGKGQRVLREEHRVDFGKDRNAESAHLLAAVENARR